MPLDWLGVALCGCIVAATTRRKENAALQAAATLCCLAITAFLFLRADSIGLYAGSTIAVIIMAYCPLAAEQPYQAHHSYQPAVRSGLHDAAAQFLAEKYTGNSSGRIEISTHAAGVRITCIEHHRVHDVSFSSRLCTHCSLIDTLKTALGAHADSYTYAYLRALNSHKNPIIILRHTRKGWKIKCLRKHRDRLPTDCQLHR